MRDRRTRLGPAERRAELVVAGVAALAEVPLHELSIELIAQRAGVSRALVSHYFGSRVGMQRALVTAARDAMLHATEPVELPPRERLHDTLVRTVGFVREHRSTFFALVRGVASGEPEVRAAIDEARDAQAARVLAVVFELGAVDSALLRIAVRSWIGLAEEALVEGARPDGIPDEELVDFLERSALAVAVEAGARIPA